MNSINHCLPTDLMGICPSNFSHFDVNYKYKIQDHYVPLNLTSDLRCEEISDRNAQSCDSVLNSCNEYMILEDSNLQDEDFQNNKMSSLISSTGDTLSMIPISVAVSLINVTIRNKLRNTSFESRDLLEKIDYDYRIRASSLEIERYKSLIHCKDRISVNLYYDNAHMSIISDVEKQIHCLKEDKVILTSTLISVSRTSRGGARRLRKMKQLPDIAIDIMTSWYESNQEHPYPSYAACEVIASSGNVTVEQVKKWFANKRMRKRNTKTLAQIALRRVRK